MSNWEMVSWNTVLTIKNGKNQKKVEDEHGLYPIYGSGGVMSYANDYICPEFTTIIGRKGSINSPIFVEEKFWNVDTAFGLVANTEILIPKYLYYFCIKYNFEKHNKAVTIPSLTKTDLLQIKIPLPPLEEQKRIAKNLDLASELVKLHKTELAELDKLIQSVFYDMFGDPVTNEKGWGIEKLNAVCDVRDGTHDSPKYVEQGYPLITSKNISNGNIDFKNVNYITFDDLEKINKRSKVDNGDIIMPMIGTIGNPIIVITDKIFAVKNVAIIKFSKSQMSNIFIKSLLMSSYFDDAIRKNNKGGTQKFISLGDIRKLLVPLPPLPIQQKFADIVTEIENQKTQVQTALNDAEQLYNSLMQEYFE
ncbi:MAG: restriction endonuclease subunit S [Clostridia bacterium]